MNGTEWTAVQAGTHWLNKLAEELGRDAMTEIRELDAQGWTPGEIALAIIEGAQPHGVEMRSMIHIRCYPYEKAIILRASYPNKLEDFVKTALIEKAMTTEIVPNPNRKRRES
jgi:hypothetical protein